MGRKHRASFDKLRTGRAWSIGHRVLKARSQEPEFRIIPVQGTRCKVQGEMLNKIHTIPVPYTLYLNYWLLDSISGAYCLVAEKE